MFNVAKLATCSCCGMIQSVPQLAPQQKAVCARCHTCVRRAGGIGKSNSRTAALATAALILYPVAVGVPMLRIEKFGHYNETGIIGGAITLLTGGHALIGLIVLLCSVILPLGKLTGLLVLSTGRFLRQTRHRAMTYHLVEWTGRWGMLDVLLVAILVAALKLGDMVDVSAGPAALAFTAVVVLSLLSAASFDPHALWRSDDNIREQQS